MHDLPLHDPIVSNQTFGGSYLPTTGVGAYSKYPPLGLFSGNENVILDMNVGRSLKSTNKSALIFFSIFFELFA